MTRRSLRAYSHVNVQPNRTRLRPDLGARASCRLARRPLQDAGSHGRARVPTSLAKGLEFDHVLLLEPAGIVAGEADHVTGLRRLYVCLTRAVTSLVVLHTSNLPGELGEPPNVEKVTASQR